MHTIETGVQITRRKFVHILRDPAGETLWTSRSINELLEVAAARDIKILMLVTENTRWRCWLRVNHTGEP